MNYENWVVITTVGTQFTAVQKMISLLGREWKFVIVGDVKTPDAWNDLPVDFLSIERQHDEFGPVSHKMPVNHYCRKNLGYLYAIRNGAKKILETDDDNYPYENFGFLLGERVTGNLVGGVDWLNIYSHFTAERIWPRGLPLDAIQQAGEIIETEHTAACPVQQFLADADPDVDSIYRLVFPDQAVSFNHSSPSVIVDENVWVPFNSQNTLFYEIAFPLLYLPHHVSFRMTDIWRSFVAQATLWLMGARLAFHTSTVEQIRNEHDLMRDFSDEVPGYLSNRNIAMQISKQADKIRASGNISPASIASSLWHDLIDHQIIPEIERNLFNEWRVILEQHTV